MQSPSLKGIGAARRIVVLAAMIGICWLPVSRPAVSQHLRVLKDVGLVVDERDGTRRRYRVDPQGLAVLRTHLDQFWERSLAAFAEAAEAPAEEPEE